MTEIPPGESPQESLSEQPDPLGSLEGRMFTTGETGGLPKEYEAGLKTIKIEGGRWNEWPQETQEQTGIRGLYQVSKFEPRPEGGQTELRTDYEVGVDGFVNTRTTTFFYVRGEDGLVDIGISSPYEHFKPQRPITMDAEVVQEVDP